MRDRETMRCWTMDRGRLTMTVVPDLVKSGDTWLWTVRDRERRYALLAEGQVASMQEAKALAERAAESLLDD